MTIRPLHDNLIVQALDEHQVTAAGIVLPDTAKEKPQQGVIKYVGPGKVLENGTRTTPSVKVGDKILFKKYAPDEIKIEGVEYLVISESDVIAVLES